MEKNDAAFPFEFGGFNNDWLVPGMTPLFYAAVHLKTTHHDLPDWLNQMIDRSRRDDFARAAMQGLNAAEWTKTMTATIMASVSNDLANAMMEESK